MKIRILLFPILFGLFFISSYGQIVIKETIKLNEQTILKKENNAKHTLNLFLTWDNPAFEVLQMVYDREWNLITDLPLSTSMSEELIVDDFTPNIITHRIVKSGPVGEKANFRLVTKIDGITVTDYSPYLGQQDITIHNVLAYDVGFKVFTGKETENGEIKESIDISIDQFNSKPTSVNLYSDSLRIKIIEGFNEYELIYTPRGQNNEVSIGSEVCFTYYGNVQYGSNKYLSKYDIRQYPKLKVVTKPDAIFDEDKYLILQMTCGSINKYDTLKIKSNEVKNYIIPSFNKPLTPGDTIGINLLKQRGDENPELFEADQLFEIGIAEGCEFSRILTIDNKTGDYFNSVHQPIKIIIDEYIDTDSLDLKLQIGAISESVIYYPKDSTSMPQVLLKSNDENPDCGKYNYNLLHYYLLTGKIENSIDHFNIEIKPDPLSNGSQTAKKDTIAFTETASLFVVAVDENGSEVKLNDNVKLKFSIPENSQYLTFVKHNGDTVKTTPVELFKTTYKDAKEGKIKIAAVKNNPDSIITAKVRVEKENENTVFGERNAEILCQSLEIILEERATVWPRYRRTHVDSSRINFNISLTRNGNSVNNHRIKLSTNYIEESGGHEHTNKRPDHENYYGYFLLPESSTHYRQLLDTITTNGCIENIRYSASIFGDTMVVYLQSLENILLKDSLKIAERVTNLINLQASQHYVLVGAPGNHSETNDPCRGNPPTSLHNNNHYGTQELINVIDSLATAYYNFQNGDRLRINDMSLINGGLFDANNDWHSPHRTHRIGTNVDIGFTVINSQNVCKNINRRLFAQIASEFTEINILVEGDHYHIGVE